LRRRFSSLLSAPEWTLKWTTPLLEPFCAKAASLERVAGMLKALGVDSID
jgi:hypothetical protein